MERRKIRRITGQDSKLVWDTVPVQTTQNATISAPARENTPRLTKVLKGAREDLEDAELPGIVGKVFGPVRDRVLDIEDFIVEKLRKDPRYDLVITGHSLGAGNATLISLKLNYEHHFAKIRGLEIVKVRCFAFAPPPFYMPNDSSKFSEATKNTYSFMHENDSVPFIP